MQICKYRKYAKWLPKAKVSISCDFPLHILNSFWGNCLDVFVSNLLVYYARLPSFRLSFISFSVKVIPYRIYNIQVCTLSVFYQLCFSPNTVSLALAVRLGSL